MIDTHPNYSQSGEVESWTIRVTNGSIGAFRELVARACNVWDTAPNEIKYFHDDIIHGMGLQNYNAMPVMRPREDLVESERFRLDTPPISKVEKEKTSSQKINPVVGKD